MADELRYTLLPAVMCRLAGVCVAALAVFSGSSLHAQVAFASPNDKLRVLAPLVAERVSTGPVTFRLREGIRTEVSNRTRRPALERVSRASQIDPERLELWLELLLAHGREGLVSLADARAVPLAKQVQGTWTMVNRHVRNDVSQVQTRIYNDIIEMREGYAKIRTLTVEAGHLDLGAPPDTQAGDEFSLAAYGTITHEDVSGKAYGLSEGETAVLQTFEGEFIAVNFPGIPPEGATVVTQALLSYTNFNSVEHYERLSREIAVGDIDDFWRRASRDPRVLNSVIRPALAEHHK